MIRQRMKHTIKFRKSILNSNWAGNYSVIADTSIINMFYYLAKERTDFKINKIMIREQSSNIRSKVVIHCCHENEWNKFIVDFLKEFDGYIENISIK